MSRSWPSRSFLYGSLLEAGVDVYAVDRLVEAALASGRWPGRFGVLLLDVAGFSSGEVAGILHAASEAGLAQVLLCGVFEEVLLPCPLPPGVARVPKPVSVGEVVRLIGRWVGRAGGDRAGKGRR